MVTRSHIDLTRFPLLGPLAPGTVQHHEVALPGSELTGVTWPVTTVTGSRSGPIIFINAGIHGGEYPAIETVIRLGKSLNPKDLAGTVVLMPVVNLPAFWQRSMFVCPVDNLNPNRTFPGDPHGSYTEQLVHALTNEFIVHADLHIDLHGGDMVEDLVPFSICQQGESAANKTALELAMVFGLPNVLVVDRPVQVSNGTLSYAAAAARGIPSFIAEAGGVGQLQQDAVDLLQAGVFRVLHHLHMLETAVPGCAQPTLLRSFEWLYCQNAGMFYPNVATNQAVEVGRVVGTIGSLFGEALEEITSPVAGRVLFLTSSPAVVKDGLLMGIGVAS